jgi:4-amino-4-deoxy-L-arabinose transferase-like glycosyltransferase
VILCVTVLWFAALGTRALYDPDEGRYAEIPREMLRGGDWIIPHLNDLTYLEKPPLQYWLTALSFRGFGETAMAARLCTTATPSCVRKRVIYCWRKACQCARSPASALGSL